MFGRSLTLVTTLTFAALVTSALATPGFATANAVQLFAIGTEWRLLDRSPDGAIVVAVNLGPTTVCTFAIPSGEQIACTDLLEEEIRMARDSITWAPDSSAFVFAEAALTYLTDGDLWQVDASSGELSNITDDGYAGNIPLFTSTGDEGTFHIDLAPAWSPAGAVIAFARSTYSGDPDGIPTELWTLDLESGREAMIAQFDPEGLGLLPYGIAWSPDASSIYVSFAHPDYTDDRNGAWSVDVDSGKSTQLTDASAERDGHAPAVLSVSPTGDAILLEYPYHIVTADPTDDRSSYALLDLATGAISPVEAPGSSDSPRRPIAPTFSPNGEYVVFAVRDLGTGTGSLATLQIDTGHVTEIATLPNEILLSTVDPGVSIVIGEDGTAFVQTKPFAGYLVPLPDNLLTPSPKS